MVLIWKHAKISLLMKVVLVGTENSVISVTTMPLASSAFHETQREEIFWLKVEMYGKDDGYKV